MFFAAIIKCFVYPKFPLSNNNFESMHSNFNSKLNVKSTQNLFSVDLYFELIYEFITELMVFAKYADFRTEKTTFI